jgi:hypothetical protein
MLMLDSPLVLSEFPPQGPFAHVLSKNELSLFIKGTKSFTEIFIYIFWHSIVPAYVWWR